LLFRVVEILYPWVCGTFQSPNAWAWWHCDLLQAVMTSAGHTLDLQELNFVQEQLAITSITFFVCAIFMLVI
jgi:hypothetical protein